MNQQEANKVAEACRRIDGGCTYCVDEMCKRLNKAKLGFVFTMDSSNNEPDPLVIATPTPPEDTTALSHTYFDAP